MKKNTLYIFTLFFTAAFLHAADLTPHQKNPIATDAIFLKIVTNHTSLTQRWSIIHMPINDIPRCIIPVYQKATDQTNFTTKSIRFIGIRYSDRSEEIDENMPENTAVTQLPFQKLGKPIQLEYLDVLRARRKK